MPTCPRLPNAVTFATPGASRHQGQPLSHRGKDRGSFVARTQTQKAQRERRCIPSTESGDLKPPGAGRAAGLLSRRCGVTRPQRRASSHLQHGDLGTRKAAQSAAHGLITSSGHQNNRYALDTTAGVGSGGTGKGTSCSRSQLRVGCSRPQKY